MFFYFLYRFDKNKSYFVTEKAPTAVSTMNEYGDNQQNILLTSAAQTSLIKKCCMTGGTPWGFRIMTDLNSILKPGILSNLVVSKVNFKLLS